MIESNDSLPRLHLLDALRGVAALTVVFYHWQHFAYSGQVLRSSFNASEQPMFHTFSIFYLSGGSAVDLFFVLSGFIFYLLYSERISRREISFRNFVFLRLSRLYPLFLITLLITVLLQLQYSERFGDTFVYGNFDMYHFALNLLMANALGLEKGYSYNGPAWSAAVEWSLYLLFFTLCRAGWSSFLTILHVMVFGFIALRFFHQPLSRGVGSFFLGGLVFHVYGTLNVNTRRRHIAKILVSITSLAWITALTLNYLTVLNIGSWLSSPIGRTLLLLIAFPFTVLSLALFETTHRHVSIRQPLRFLGDISYSSYLLHFPLQLSVVLMMAHFEVELELWRSTAGLSSFFLLLLVLSWLSFRHFERPVQQWLRTALLTKPSLPVALHE